MERFSTKLENRWVALNRLVDAVKFSFIARNSISYLNLHLCEYSDLNDRSRTVSEVANDFVCTEEKCRKVFEPSRSLLYNLNLDMPAGREYSLKNDLPAGRFSRNTGIPHIAKITVTCSFDVRNMSLSIDDAFKVADQKLKILRFLVNSPPRLKKEIIFFLPAHIMNNFIDCFYPKITDSVLFKGFLQTLDLFGWISKYEEPEILEHLLYHVRQNRRGVVRHGYLCELIDECILSLNISNIHPILKYTDAPGFSSGGYSMYISEGLVFDRNLDEDLFAAIEKKMTKQRLYWMLQIHRMYVDADLHRTKTSETLHLLWNSSSVAYVTFGEIERAFSGVIADEVLAGMYQLYCESIGEDHSVVEPRSLKHLCRTTIRRIVKNNYWIPEGVKLTGLPESLQAFLNLE